MLVLLVIVTAMKCNSGVFSLPRMMFPQSIFGQTFEQRTGYREVLKVSEIETLGNKVEYLIRKA